MIEIDGSHGEGGGQVLRTSLALSIVTGKPFRLFNIRAGRPNAGLQNQHLACVQAAQQVSRASVSGCKRRSRELAFRPEHAVSGAFEFDIKTAGSTGLLLQTILYPLLMADNASSLRIRGGTHNPWAPSFHFLQHTLLPLLGDMGVRCALELVQYGFYPTGGGVIRAEIEPWKERRALQILERDTRVTWGAETVSAGLPDHVGERELHVFRQRFAMSEFFSQSWHRDSTGRRVVATELHAGNQRVTASGKGNAAMLYARTKSHVETFTGIGKAGKPAEEVASEVCEEAESWLEAGVPVGEHLADQLLLPMALGAGGRFRTLEPSGHTRTNIETIRQFLDVRISCEQSGDAWTISVES